LHLACQILANPLFIKAFAGIFVSEKRPNKEKFIRNPFPKNAMTRKHQKDQMEMVERFYTFLNWYTSRIARFPRQSRVLIGQPIQDRLIVTMDLLIEAVYSPNREKILNQINICLDRLRYLTRLCVDQQLLNLKQMEFAAAELNIVGGMLGNWLKTVKKKAGIR
ncbi:diversity-generating retroelement protein Avd, partial [bacterium]|nr:diversity-generating retroelement protein Avd [bacterium]